MNISVMCAGETTDSLHLKETKTTESHSSNTLVLPEDVQAAFDVLRGAFRFPTSEGIGNAGVKPKEITAFQKIIGTKYANSIFKSLLAQKEIVPRTEKDAQFIAVIRRGAGDPRSAIVSRLIGLCGVYF